MDWIIDGFVLIFGIAGTVFMIIKRKNFDLWISIPVCAACILKGIRSFCYEWFERAMKNTQEITATINLMRIAQVVLDWLDETIILFLIAALIALLCQPLRRRKTG